MIETQKHLTQVVMLDQLERGNEDPLTDDNVKEVLPLPQLTDYRGTSLIRNSAPLGPYSRSMPRALWWS